MALESLAPDQRAVVQLVLQQGRSYAALAGLLGISEDAVRQRAHAGLGSLGTGSSLGADERGLVADFLLGQQEDDRRREAVALLTESEPARQWALDVAAALAPVARHGLPEIPGGEPPTLIRPSEPRPAEPEPARRRPREVEPEAPRRPEPEAAHNTKPAAAPPRRRPRDEEADAPRRPRPPVAEDDLEAQDDDPETPRRRRRRGAEEGADAAARPRSATTRPRRERQRPRRDVPVVAPDDRKDDADGADKPGAPSSRVGGAILILGLAVLLAAFVAWTLSRDDDPETAATPTTTTQATNATPEQRPLAQLPLRAVGGAKGEGLVQINLTGEQVGFTLVARNVEPNTERDAYAVWLTGRGREPLRLGFAARVGEDRTLATSGPEEKTDPARFATGLTQYGQMVVSRETTDTAKAPTTVVLRASLAQLRQQAGGAQGGGEGEQGGGGGE